MLSGNGTDFAKGGLHDSSTPIQIPPSEPITKTLVDLIMNPAKAKLSSFDDAQTLLILCDEFDMPSLKYTVHGKLYPFADQHAIKIFCIASHSNDLELAKQALLRWCDGHEALDDDNISSSFYTPEFVHNCKPSYLCALLKLILSREQSNRAKSGSHAFRISPIEWRNRVSYFEGV
jgi:hypothetical protein